MIVRHKQSGKLGKIPDDKFDPALFEKVQDTTTQITGGQMDIANPEFQQVEQPKKKKSIFQSIVDPFVRTISNIGTAAITVPQIAVASLVSKKKPELGAKIASQDILGTQKKAKEISDDPKKALKRQLKDSVNVASYTIPFGKGSSVATRALIPGATVGAVQEATTNEEADIESISKSAIFGAATAGVLDSAGRLLNKAKGTLSKTSAGTEKIATNLKEGTRKIKVKPSVSGAQQEKAINKTLDRLGFKGSAQKQYENLQPAMNKLEKEINTIIKKNPDVSVAKEDIKKAFAEKLKSSIRTKEMTSKQATVEVEGYLKDLLKASGGKGKFTNIDLGKLRELKRLINQDYGSIAAKKIRGTPLTAREKVIDVAWSSIDDAVKNASPEVKSILKDESNLYKAASSLSNARFNPPTLRVGGTSFPQFLAQPIRETGTKAFQKTSKITGAASKLVPQLTQGAETMGGQVVSRIQPSLNEGQSNGQNNKENGNGNQNQQVSNNYLDNQGGFPFSNTNISQPGGAQQQLQKTITGHTVEEHLQALSKATVAGNKKAVAQIKAQLAIEQDYQEETGGGTGLNVGKVTAQNYSNSLSGGDSFGRAVDLLFDENGSLNKGLIVALKTPGTPNQKARQLKAYLYNVADSYLRLRTGAQANPEEIKRLAESLEPGILDNAETVASKLQIYQQTFKQVLESAQQGGIGDETQLGGFSVAQ